jgi:CheY-like chemotaxis protein
MCHVLIIEDEPLVAMDLEMMLEEAGATSFDVAATEAEAIEAARNHPPQLITSDMRLLDGTGPAAVRVIIAEQGEVPVIFISGTPEDCQPCSAKAVVLGKPFRRGSVVDMFRRLAPV